MIINQKHIAKNIPNVISSTTVIDKRSNLFSFSTTTPSSLISISKSSPSNHHQTDDTTNTEGQSFATATTTKTLNSQINYDDDDDDKPNDAFNNSTTMSSENEGVADQAKTASIVCVVDNDDVSPSAAADATAASAKGAEVNKLTEEIQESSSQTNANCSSYLSQTLSRIALNAASAKAKLLATDDIPVDTIDDENCITKNITGSLQKKVLHGVPNPIRACRPQVMCLVGHKKRGWGWGPTPIGLRGGGESAIANGGSSGWGPPPPANAGASRGWGAVPPNPNPAASAGWGAAPNPAAAPGPLAVAAAVNNDDSNSNNGGAGVAKNPGNSTPPSAVGSQPGGSGGPPASAGPTTTSTSWAAAAGKGLPAHNDTNSGGAPGAGPGGNQAGGSGNPSGAGNPANGGGSGTAPGSSTTSKHALESLQSVRDALFSQDGWGGSNVKQDNSWDIGGAGDGSGMPKKDVGGAGAGPGGAGGGPSRNDGTDLWKSNLSGNPPPVPKPQQPANPWGSYTPRVDNDGGTWGEDDGGAGARQGPGGPGDHQGPPLGPPGSIPPGTGAPGANQAFGGPSGPNTFGANSSGGGPPGPGRDANFWNQPDQPNNGPGFGPPKPKDDWGGNGAPGGGSNWGDPMGRGGPVQRDADLNVRNEGRGVGSGWGGPSGGPQGPGQQRQQPGGGGSWGAPPPSTGGGGGRAPGVWDHESPNMNRRIDDQSSAYHWGRDKVPPGPPGVSNWKDMPTPGPIPAPIRGGPPGPRPSYPPNKSDVWGAGPSNRPWGEPDQPPPGGAPGGGSSGWGDPSDSMKPRDNLGWGETPGAGSGWGPAPTRPARPMGGIQRGSPGWGDPDPPGMGGQDGSSGWGPKPPGPSGPKKMVTAEMVWSSRQFRMLCDMGISKGDAESALRQTSLNLEDALELLTSHGRMPGGMGGRNGPSGGPPSGDSPFQPPGPAGGNNPYNNRRDFGNGPGGMPFPTDSGPGQPGLTPPLPGFNPMNGPKMGGPGSNGLIPGGNNSLRQPGNVAAAPNSVNQNASGGSGSNSQPSAQQLKLLVQQIQMAVSAGHLNPQILNQPLAPQTLVLLNQLLQQIKTLQGYQHTMQTQKQHGTSSSMSMLTVDITKTKQEIQNLQNQISAQQANYLKQQMPSSMPPPPGAPSGNPNGNNGPNINNDTGFSGILGLGGGSSPGGGPGGMPPSSSSAGGGSGLPGVPTASDSGSRLNKWITAAQENAGQGGFPKAPGGAKIPITTAADDTWGPPNTSTGGGWPDSSQKQQSQEAGSTSNAATGAGGAATNGSDIDNFGIPEFVPGKQWKGPGMKNPDEDPNMTPGSVAMSAVDLNPLSKAGSNSSLGVTSSAATTSTVENSLGLGGWGSTMASTSSAITKDTWSNGMPASGNNSTNLTQMGQDLWGKSAAVGRTPPGLGGSNPAWPATSSSSTSNGWGGPGPATNGGANGASDASGAAGPSWLLLKNLTPQIDGSTLKTLCMQHAQQGPLKAFHLFLNQGLALVHYTTGGNAQRAQKHLNGSQLNNTTIQAQSIFDHEAEAFLRNASGGVPSRGATPSSLASAGGAGGPAPIVSKPSSDVGSGWGNTLGGGGSAGGSTWGDLGLGDQRTTPQLQSFLPNDLLGESNN